jgi:hypothetical protein
MTSREAFEAWVEDHAAKNWPSSGGPLGYYAAAWVGWQARDAEIAELRAALAELVALKDLKERAESLGYGGFFGMVSAVGFQMEPSYDEAMALMDDYARRKPLARAAARAALDAQRKI